MIFVKRSYTRVIEQSCDRGVQGEHCFKGSICEITKQALHLKNGIFIKTQRDDLFPKIKDL